MFSIRDDPWRRRWRPAVGVGALALIVIAMFMPAILALTHPSDNGCGCIGDCTCGHGMMMDGAACARGVPSDIPTLRQCRTESDELALTSVDFTMESPFEFLTPTLELARTASLRRVPASVAILPDTPPPEPST